MLVSTAVHIIIFLLTMQTTFCLNCTTDFGHETMREITVCEISSLSQVSLNIMKTYGLTLTCKSTSKEISNFPSDTFGRLESLYYLEIINCNVFQLQSSAFQGLNNLVYLSFTSPIYNTDNHKQTLNISETIFDSTPNMGSIKLPSMGVNKLPSAIFCKLKNFQNLDLSSNNIADLNDTGCRNSCCSKLRILSLRKNQLRRIKSGVFDHMPLLYSVDLQNNKLIELEENLFRNNSRLTQLDLSFNRLLYLNGNIFPQSIQDIKLNNNHLFFNDSFSTTFDGLENLGYLDLSWNKINYLPSGLFDSLQKLTHLDLSNNGINHLPPGLFDSLTTLIDMNLNDNILRELRCDNFPALSGLRYLNLRNNRITNVSKCVFPKLKNLQELDLSLNRMKNIRWRFTSILDQLNVSHNELITYPKLNVLSLRELYLQNNQIQTFTCKDVSRSTVVINLTSNRLRTISCRRWILPFNFTVFFASYNKLQNFTELFNLPNIKEIILTNNNISSIRGLSRRAATKLRLVDLRNNSMTEIPYADIHDSNFTFEFESKIDIRHNPIICSCKNEWMVNSKHSEIKMDEFCSVHYPRERRFSSSLIMSQNHKDKMFCRDEKCPSECLCYYNNFNRYIMDCFNVSWKYPMRKIPSRSTIIFFDANTNLSSGLGYFSMNLPVLQTLYMNNSDLTNISDETLCCMPNVKELHLEENYLSIITENMFQSTTKLEKLYFHRNLLQSISPNAFKNLKLTLITLHENKLLQPKLWTMALHSLEISLSGNPFQCDCDFVVPFKKWIVNNSQVKFKDLNNTMCSQSTISIMHFDQTVCFTTDTDITAFVLMGITFSVLIILIFLIFYYRLELKILLYSRYRIRLFYGNPEADKEKIYHAFISYANEDDEWITETLMSRLTEYKLCLHQRDFIVGKHISKSIIQAVENSCRTVIILSPHFLKSNWCRFEFETAHMQSLMDKYHQLVVVILEDYDKNKLTASMRAYMRTNTYLDRNDRMFWSKLKYALPNVDCNLRKANKYLEEEEMF